MGKTVTAELAYFAPGPTANPWNLERTPGGSSMGSAAAVAAGIVTIAIGSQTNGSVIRPAAFCGVVGFKPSAGLIPTRGVLRFSPSLDQVGSFARTVDYAAAAAAVMAGVAPSSWNARGSSRTAPRLAVVHPPEWEDAEPAAREALAHVLRLAESAGAAVDVIDLPAALLDAVPIHRVLMAREANRFIGNLLGERQRLCSPQLQALLEEGAAISSARYREARRFQLALAKDFPNWFGRHDALLSLPTYGEAPPLATTGDPRWCTRWTLMGAPAISLPVRLGPNGLPLGIQAVAPAGSDAKLLRVARWLEALIPALPALSPPAA
jgi:Asp-tRNA(Asn)/Glu-tRNA(Gln) amidotransferase A subunit family amidase